MFRFAAGRLLGIRVGRANGTLSAIAGLTVGWLVSFRIPRGAGNFAVFVSVGLIATLGWVVALSFVARPATLGRLERSFTPPLHPVRALRQRIDRSRRYIEVLRIALRHRLLSRLAAPSGTLAPEDEERFGRDLTRALQEAGGIFVKLGQVLASRADLLAPQVTDQLTALQDRVTPVDKKEITSVLEDELGRPLSQLFTSFDTDPVAAASIGQVHRASLPTGTQVAVKVQRPGVEERARRDLDVILRLAKHL